MKVLITGAQGQLGLELRRQLQDCNQYTVTAADRKTLDITDMVAVQDFLNKGGYNIVINCGAYTAVDKCEEDQQEAYKVNALGPKHLAIACDALGAKLIHISTDYVFSGEGKVPRREDDLVSPGNIYGKSKLLGEEYIKSFSKQYFIIRTAWLYGEGNNFVKTMLTLAEKNTKLQVVGDQFGSPTWTKDLARVVISLMATEYYGVYHGTSEGECSWHDFACKIFQLKAIEIQVEKVTSDVFKTVAPRPKYSVLDNFNLKLYGLNSFRHWEDALEEYLKGEASDGEV